VASSDGLEGAWLLRTAWPPGRIEVAWLAPMPRNNAMMLLISCTTFKFFKPLGGFSTEPIISC
jgi:hypothetical protein